MNWLRWLWRKILRWVYPPPTPPIVIPFLTDEVFMSELKRDGLIYSVDVPALPKVGDLASQELCVHFMGGESKIAVDIEGGKVNFMVPQDEEASVHLVYVDDGGNKSEGPLFTFKAIDTINTFAPPGFGEVALVEEVFGAYTVEGIDEDGEVVDVVVDEGVTDSPIVEGEEEDTDDGIEPEVDSPQGPSI
jgi:hypothetical protein